MPPFWHHPFAYVFSYMFPFFLYGGVDQLLQEIWERERVIFNVQIWFGWRIPQQVEASAWDAGALQFRGWYPTECNDHNRSSTNSGSVGRFAELRSWKVWLAKSWWTLETWRRKLQIAVVWFCGGIYIDQQNIIRIKEMLLGSKTYC